MESSPRTAPAPPVFPEDRIAYFVIEPGQAPEPSSATAITGGVDGAASVWVDVVGLTNADVVKLVEPLALPALQHQDIRLLATALSPEDSWWASELGENYDPARASDIAIGRGDVQLVHSFEPIFVEIGSGVDARWSIVSLRVSTLIGPGWIVTSRSQPVDLRWGTHHQLPVHPRALLAQHLKAPTTDLLTQDLAVMLLRWLATRAVTVAHEVGVEIGRRALDFHRSLADEPDQLGDPRRVQRALYDLRWTLDALELGVRGQSPSIAPATRALLKSAGRAPEIAEDTRERLREALEICEEGRRRMAEILAWLAAEQTQALLEAQVDASARSSRLQTLLAFITAAFLGPTLVATIFGASPSWWQDHQGLRGGAMAGAMLLTGGATAVLFRLLRHDQHAGVAISELVEGSGRLPDDSASRGRFGNPIYRWPHRLLGWEINCYRPGRSCDNS